MTRNRHRPVRIVVIALLCWAATSRLAQAADPAPEPGWLGDDLPLPLAVKSPQDMAFKSAAERQYLIFNLMAGGKLAFDRGDYPDASAKWETLLRLPGLDPQVEQAVRPLLDDARARAGQPAAQAQPAAPGSGTSAAGSAPRERISPPPRRTTVTVGGSVSGGGPAGPGGAVIWLKRLDDHGPRPTPAQNQIVTQREKTFLPHVLAIPVGTSVQFRNDDRIYHNVFSIAKPNDFDGGIRANGATYVKTFNHPGVVQLLCNIHATMNAYVVVVDSPYYAKAQASGAFTIHGVLPGRYDLAAWHEAASVVTHKTITVGPEGTRDLAVPVGGDKRPAPFVPDKYGHKRQPQLGY